MKAYSKEPQSAREQTITVGIMNDILRHDSTGDQRPRHDLSPDFHITTGIPHDGGFTSRPA